VGRSHNPGVFYNPKVVTDGLVLALDAGNAKKSYKTDNNLLDLSGWAVGATSVSGFIFNGTTDENALILDTDPFGNTAVIWKAYNNNPTDLGFHDGGFLGGYISIDHTKLYRFSVWVNREVISTSGKIIFAVSPDTSGNSNPNSTTLVDILNRTDGNPDVQFFESDEPVTEIPEDEWVLFVAHIWPSGSGTGDNKSDTGIYNTVGIKTRTINDLVWTTNILGAALYIQNYNYTTSPTDDPDAVQLHAYPRIDLVDGTEPSIEDLVNNRVNSLYWYDSSNVHGDFNLLNGPTFDSANGGSLVFDGDDAAAVERPGWPPGGTNSTNNSMTWEAWVYQTSNAATYNIFMGHNFPDFGFYFTFGLSFALRIGPNAVTNTLQTLTAYIPTSMMNNWIHTTFTTSYNGSSTTMKIYANGTEIATRNRTGSSQNAVGRNFTIGNKSDLSGTFNGKIAIVRVYNRTLSASEVQQNFNALKGRFGL